MVGLCEAIEDGWVWIAFRFSDFDMIDVATARGDDMNTWLASMEEDHELVEWVDDGFRDSDDVDSFDSDDVSDQYDSDELDDIIGFNNPGDHDTYSADE